LWTIIEKQETNMKQNKFAMRNLLLLLTGIISATFCFAGSVDTIPAGNGLIEYTGRIDFSDPDAPKFSYSGVSIRACFTGTSIGMIMDDNTGQNYYNLILDGKLLDTVKITTGKKTYKIADGLENTTHEIEIIKRTEEMFGKTQFFGFVVDLGSSLTAIASQRNKMIEYIGNSITCGYGNEGQNGGTFGPTTENHYMTYAAITSRNFNARDLAVCKSGIGIYRNYDGPAAGNADCMTNYYTRTFLFDENPKYSFSERPDLVCIDLGTNDFSTTGGDSAKFVSNYFRLIDTIQTKYTMPDILCLLGPMLSDPALTKVRKYLKYIADSASRKGMGNVYFFEMSQQTGSLGLGIDYHPTVAQHKKNGMELTDYIKSLKSWKIYPLVINANVDGTKHILLEFNTPVQDSLNTFSGFTVNGDGTQYTISSIYTDTANAKIVHIILQQSMVVGEKILLSYTPGTLESIDSVPVSAINSLPVQNNLTDTKITRGTTNADGTSVTLICNKNIKENSGIDGLTLVDSHGILAIDSFSIVKMQLILYLENTIIKADSVFASYTGTGLYGADGIPLGAFSKLVIKNISKYTGISMPVQNFTYIYPNPNHTGVFYYSIDKSMFSKKAAIEIIGSNGIIIERQMLTAADGQLDLNGKLSKGVYFFRITSGDSVIRKTIVLE
jgi:Carbohydrate esterase 2 N-terminal/GDSL-like Lipase/Acylhydrolase family/Secretion system C-terminal sorting domain